MFDVVFLSYDEENIDKLWKQFKSRFPYAIHVHGIKGIHNAHREAARRCMTKCFYVVDADAEVDSEFDFSFQPEPGMCDTVHVWKARNPINHLEYGYGGIKLFPRLQVLNSTNTEADFATSVSYKYKSVDIVASTTRFDKTKLSTWRSAFRECAKLAWHIRNNKVSTKEQYHLKVWLGRYIVNSRASNHKFYDDCIKGSFEGYRFASSATEEEFKQINDFDWLYQEYIKWLLANE